MSSVFCCSSIQPYRPQYIDHESKFSSFISWGGFPKESSLPLNENDKSDPDLKAAYAIQLVRQVNFGPLESKRYFVPAEETGAFVEVTEDALIQANFQKVNSYKNFKCERHNKFFELNLYQKDPFNKHHWRANIARPAGSIDL